MTKSALIVGVSGQDGSLIAKLLLEKGYRVVGTSRDAASNPFTSLRRLGIRGEVETRDLDTEDLDGVLQIVEEVKPDEIYNVGGQSSVAESFKDPEGTMRSHLAPLMTFAEAMRNADYEIRMYNAGSGECFGDIGKKAADETTLFAPLSPYADAKTVAHVMGLEMREMEGLYVANGIAFNHESPLRPPHFVTRKVTSAVKRIAEGSREKLSLGDLSIKRDWGWAPEYVEAMWLMLQREEPEDYVLATGISHSLEEFVAAAFGCVGLDWRDHVESDKSLFRPSEIRANRGNARKAEQDLGWKATVTMPEIVRRMVEEEV